jgi:hypothetical protein
MARRGPPKGEDFACQVLENFDHCPARKAELWYRTYFNLRQERPDLLELCVRLQKVQSPWPSLKLSGQDVSQ